MKNPLLDKDFLKQLDEYQHKEKYAKIISLSFDTEMPQQEIEGRVTNGTINVDGSSAVRRTCSLSMISDTQANDRKFWYENSKFKVYIGLKNEINTSYPDIIWFPMGLYIVTSFNQTISNNANNISISGKDKMCLLNGEVGGKITALSWDFGTIDDVQEDGTIVNTNIPIHQIILDLVHQFAQEKYENILINDLDEASLELLNYKGNEDTPLYLIINENTSEIAQISIDGDIKFGNYTLSTIPHYYSRFDLWNQQDPELTRVEVEGNTYVVSKVTTEETAGYRETELTYSGELIASVGDSATSILDKIVTMLGNYEYYYDLDGKFVFQRKKNYISTSFNNLITNDGTVYAENNSDTSAVVYNFSGDQLITNFTNTPTLNNLANDYAIWGTKTSASGSSIPIHLRYVIDKKPTFYKTIGNEVYYTNGTYDTYYLNGIACATEADVVNEAYKYLRNKHPNLKEDTAKAWSKDFNTVKNYSGISYYTYTDTDGDNILDEDEESSLEGPFVYPVLTYSYQVDWREIIYQMALDYYKHGTEDDFGYQLTLNNGNDIDGNPIYSNGLTGYEQYYVDIEGFWRQLYCPKGEDKYYTITVSETDYKNHIKQFNNLGYLYGPNCYYYNSDGKYVLDDSLEKVSGRNYYHKYYEYEYVGKEGDAKFNYEASTYYYIKDGIYILDGSISATTDREYYSRNGKYESITLNNSINWTAQAYYVPNYNYIGTGGQSSFTYKSSTYYYIINDLFILDTSLNVTAGREYYEKLEDSYLLDTEDVVKVREYYNAVNTYYYTRKYNDNTKLYDYTLASGAYVSGTAYYIKNNNDDTYYDSTGWISTLLTSPESINFWFDFLDNDAEMSKYSVKLIGDRPKTTNDDTVKAIYFRETPMIIFTDSLNGIDRKYNYVYMQYQPGLAQLFTLSSQGKSAKDLLDEQLYNYSYCIESIQLTTIPIYYLEPNTRISIDNNTSEINGEYIMSKFTLPLNYNGTMSITATKVPTRLY